MKSRNLFNLRQRLHRSMCGRCLCACDLWIMGTFILLAICFSCETPEMSASPETRTAAETPHFFPVRRVARTTLPDIEVSESYYQTIIDNNLFRPLGWTPARPSEPYRLIGTILARDANTLPKAILESTAGASTRIVTTGDTLDALTEVVAIEAQQVTLSTNGQQRTLRLNTALWLNTSDTNRHPVRKQTPTPPAATATPKTFQHESTPVPTTTPRGRVLSEWLSPDGHPIRIGDARLKNPEKWGLRRR